MRAHTLLVRLYLMDVPVDWVVSTGIFWRPTVSGASFIHPAPPAVIKWLARVRAGCLASRARLVGHGMVQGPRTCLCCAAEEEDDVHILAGCPATGTADWQSLVGDAWGVASKAAAVEVPLPPAAVLAEVHIMLLGALIPLSAAADWGLPAGAALPFLAALHRALAAGVAECLRRREELMAVARALVDPDREPMVVDGGPRMPLAR